MSVDIDILTAMNSERLFAPWFKGASWDGWRAVLKAAYALPMSDDEVAFFRRVAERDPPKKRVKELWIIAGRRSGKDSIASLICAHAAALFDGARYLRRGERALCLALGCSRDQGKIVKDYTAAYFNDIPPLQAMIQRDTLNGFELSNSVEVAIASNSYRSIRGRPILVAILDEVAFYQDETSANPDVEVYNAIRPGMATLPDSMIVGISSPYRKSGLLYEKYRKYFGQDDDAALVIRAPSILLNPTLDPAIIDQAVRDDPIAAAAEWLGEFREDVSDFITLSLLDACTPAGYVAPAPAFVRMFNPAAATDISGGTGADSFATGVSWWNPLTQRAELAAVLETPGPYSPEIAIADHANFLRSFGITKVIGDRYAGLWPVERWRAHGIRYEISHRNRSQTYLDFLPLLTSGRCTLLPHAKMRSQFMRLERRTTRSGQDSVDHPANRRSHDDVCQVAAASLLLAHERGAFGSDPESFLIGLGTPMPPLERYPFF